MIEKLHRRLIKRQEEGTLRSLSSFSGIDFYSNDYLGFAREAKPVAVTGGTGSRLISGNAPEAEASESALALFFKAEAALIFNSGYDANLGFFGCVPQRDDVVLYDAHIHASVRDGIRLGLARAHSFAHNSPEDLKDKLERLGGDVTYVAVESLYSMGGDMAPLLELVEVCEAFGAQLIVDEAHAAGVYGKSGEGIVAALGLQDRIPVRLVTFGKAYGSHGAVVLGAATLKDYLVNFARSFIYTTALSPQHYVGLTERVNRVGVSEARTLLMNRIAYFREQAVQIALPLVSEPNAPIQIVRMEVELLKTSARNLSEAGYAVKPIYSPTVPKGEECLRICIHAFNTETEIAGLVHQLRGMK